MFEVWCLLLCNILSELLGNVAEILTSLGTKPTFNFIFDNSKILFKIVLKTNV